MKAVAVKENPTVWVFCADLKSMMNVVGLSFAARKECCVWCTVKKEKLKETIANHPFPPLRYPARTGNCGPLPISIDQSCFCSLHMLLRLVEGLLKRTAMMVSEYFPSYEELGVAYTTPTKQIKVNAVSVDQFHAEVKKYAPRLYFVKPGETVDKNTNQKTKRIKINGMLNGLEATKLLENYENVLAAAKVPEYHREDLKTLWKNLRVFLQYVDDDKQIPHRELNCFGQLWVDKFQWPHIPLYLHVLVCHYNERLNKFGKIKELSQEGCESSHAYQKNLANRTTAHGGGKAQISALQIWLLQQ